MTGTGLEGLFLQKAVEALASIVIKSTWDTGSGIGSGFFRRAKLNESVRNQIFNASNKYIENYVNRHGSLKILGMNKPVNLQDIYTAVQFLDKQSILQFESIESLEAAYRQTSNRRFQWGQKQDGLNVANKQQYLMVLGQPGSGKSTFLRQIGLESLKGAERKYNHSCIPVFIELKQFYTERKNLKSLIIEELEICNFPEAKNSVDKLLEKGRFLILLDGLDEVPIDNLNGMITQIQNFVDKYDKNRFISSCRTAAYHSKFRRFVDVAIADFDDAQIQQFIDNWFQAEEDKKLRVAEKCKELLDQPEYAATRELAQTPLLLTLLCLVFDDSQTFPKNRANLYGEALDVLLKKWAAERRVQRNPIYQDLNLQLEKIMLSEIAYKSLENQRLFLSKQSITQYIKYFLEDNLNAPQHLDGEVILDAIQVQQGILVERATNIISFSHLTLQEYLAAYYVAHHIDIQSFTRQYLMNRSWREVFLLVSGLLPPGSDKLLLQMEEEAHKLIENNIKLQSLLHWTNWITNRSKSDFKPAAKRAIAIFFAHILTNNLPVDLKKALKYNLTAENILSLNVNVVRPVSRNFVLDLDDNLDPDRVLAFSFARICSLSLNNILSVNRDLILLLACSISLAYEISKLEIFQVVDFRMLISNLKSLRNKIPLDSNTTPEKRQKFANEILSLWYTSLRLDPDLVKLSDEEARILEDYLYANGLIIQAKETAIIVSSKIWLGIEERMFTSDYIR